jgi:hypothetical protein
MAARKDAQSGAELLTPTQRESRTESAARWCVSLNRIGEWRVTTSKATPGRSLIPAPSRPRRAHRLQGLERDRLDKLRPRRPASSLMPCGGWRRIPHHPTASLLRQSSVDQAAAGSRRSVRHHGSVANRSLPVGRSVRASNVRISVAPPTSKVSTTCPSATAVATMRAPLGRSAVTSAPAAPTLPSDLKTR